MTIKYGPIIVALLVIRHIVPVFIHLVCDADLHVAHALVHVFLNDLHPGAVVSAHAVAERLLAPPQHVVRQQPVKRLAKQVFLHGVIRTFAESLHPRRQAHHKFQERLVRKGDARLQARPADALVRPQQVKVAHIAHHADILSTECVVAGRLCEPAIRPENLVAHVAAEYDHVVRVVVNVFADQVIAHRCAHGGGVVALNLINGGVNGLQKLLLRQAHFVVPRAQMLRHPARPLQVHGSLQTNGIRVHHGARCLRLCHVLDHECRRHGAVQAAGQETAHRPLAHQPLAHRRFKQVTHPRARAEFQFFQIIARRIVRRKCAEVVHVRHIQGLIQAKVRVIGCQIGLKLCIGCVSRKFGHRHVAPSRKLFNVNAVLQRLHFASNRDVALVVAGTADVERPHAKRVARNMNNVVHSVNQHQRKHAVQLLQRGLHVAVEHAVQVDDHFTV